MSGNLKVLGALAMSAGLACAFASGTARADMLQAIGEPEGVVDIVAWPGYIERGETDPAFDWVTGYEEKTGCKVRIKTAGTSDEMVALMNEGGFDLVTASGDASLRLIYGDRVQEVNVELIDSYDTIDPRLQDAPWHTVDGRSKIQVRSWPLPGP
jgi:putative spermidine/putrescine transport system substrate-binding protein